MNEQIALKIGAFGLGLVVLTINIISIAIANIQVRKLNKKEPYNLTGEACIWSQLGALIPINFGATIAIVFTLIMT